MEVSQCSKNSSENLPVSVSQWPLQSKSRLERKPLAEFYIVVNIDYQMEKCFVTHF